MKNIAFFLPDLRGGGAERVAIDLAHAIAEVGYQPSFVLMKQEGDFLNEVAACFPVVDLGTVRARQVPLALAGYLRRQKPDAVIASMWPLTTIAPTVAFCSGFRGKVLVSEHGILSSQYRHWGRLHRLLLRTSTFFGYRFADGVVGVSGGVVSDLAALSRLPASRFSVIHNPVAISHYGRTVRRNEAEKFWQGMGPRFLSVGSFKRVKNHALLLRAFAKLHRKDAQLMLLGQGPEEANLRALAAELGIADRVIFAGFHADPAPFYATADLFVLSSDYEGFGNVIVEALACGLPVVSTDCPSGPGEILENGRWGRLTPVGDADALAAAMDETLKTPHDAEALKRRAADFSPAIAARKYLELLGL